MRPIKCKECKVNVVHYYRSIFCKDCIKDFFEGEKHEFIKVVQKTEKVR